VYRIAQERFVANRQCELRTEAETARLVARINRHEPRIEQRVRSALNLRLAPAR